MPAAPGDSVSHNGVYRVIHQKHRKAHEATLRKGEKFPVCRVCRNAVTFEYVRPLGKLQPEHIGYDADFVDAVVKRPKSA
jgi:hypothetical protein